MINDKISSTTIIAIVFGVLGLIFIASVGLFAYIRLKRPTHSKSFDENHRKKLEVELKEFTVTF